MGRQPKQGLDYFPFDVGLLSDPKLRRPRQKYGYLAQMTYISLLCILYRDKGYYIPYGGEHREDVIWQVGDMLNGRYATTAETISNVIDELAACELFSGDLFRRNIITSIRAQKAYYTATVDRKYVDVNFDIWLLSETDMKKLSSKSVILQSFISRPINTENRPINGDNQAKSTQSREQKSREKQSTEKYSIAENSRERAAALTADLERLIETDIDDNFRLDIARLLQAGMQDAVIMEAARQTGRKRPRNPAAYLRTILQGYERDGVLTAADLEATQGKEPRGASAPSARPHQPDANDAAWERRAREYQSDVRSRRLAAERAEREGEDNGNIRASEGASGAISGDPD